MTVEKDKTMKLPSELKKKINKMAHAAGVAHGEQVKLQLLIETDRRNKAGESQAAMLAALELRVVTDANLAAMTMTEAELMAWLTLHAVTLADG